MKYIKTYENYKGENEDTRVGIEWQSDFTLEEKEIIEDSVQERIADMVGEGYTSGELYGEEPNFNGSWSVDIQEDEEDEELRNEEVSSKIREGYTSGYYPTFSWVASVWTD